jgi:ribonuclease BN (tRNA processing enzyme)
MNNMKVSFLGTCGFGETATRNTVSILLDDHILIDAGEGVTRRLLKRGSLARLTHIFLTHGHLDHVLGLFPILWQSIIVDRREEPLVVTCPAYMEDAIKQILELMHFPLHIQRFPIEFQGLDVETETNFQISIPGYDVTGILMEHQPPCVGYRLTCKEGSDLGKTFAFTGDTRPNPSLVILGNKADLFVTECSFQTELSDIAHALNHMTPVDAAQAASKAECARMGLIHHPDYIIEHKPEVAAEVQEIYPTGELLFCEDYSEIEF